MTKLDTKKRRPAAVTMTAVIVLLACLTLAACGSSASTSSSSTAASTTSTKAGTATGNRAAFAGRFKAVRECLQKNGVTLPKRTPGQGAGGGAGGPLGGPGGTPPPGVSKSTYEAAVKKCGAPGGGSGGAGGSNSPAFKQGVAKFASCMRENGVNLPTPNTSGTGPVFNTKGLNTTSATFKAAQAKCASLLRGNLPTNPAG
jgi:hypothetical protein